MKSEVQKVEGGCVDVGGICNAKRGGGGAEEEGGSCGEGRGDCFGFLYVACVVIINAGGDRLTAGQWLW